MNEKRVVFLHCINMTSYCGHEDNIHAGGFTFSKKHGFGYEAHNFSNIDGRCYGHVEVPLIKGEERAIRLENLDPSNSATSLEGVLAVWTAPCRDGEGREVVGWYRNATLHRYAVRPKGTVKRARKFKRPDTGEQVNLDYRIDADAGDCFLLHPEKRSCRFRREKGVKGLPGQSSVYYPFRHASDEAKELRNRVLEFINESEAFSSRPRRSGGTPVWRGHEQERKKTIEIAAVKYVCEHFGSGPNGLGYKIESREDENVGYDLLISKGELTLCVEVKGRSGDGVIAEFSRNESRVICKHEHGKFIDGDYRVCIVTDALNENGKRRLHHFSWWPEKRAWIDVDGSRRLHFHPSGALGGDVRCEMGRPVRGDRFVSSSFDSIDD